MKKGSPCTFQQYAATSGAIIICFLHFSGTPVVYMLKCPRCLVYVGQTKNGFNDFISEYQTTKEHTQTMDNSIAPHYAKAISGSAAASLKFWGIEKISPSRWWPGQLTALQRHIRFIREPFDLNGFTCILELITLNKCRTCTFFPLGRYNVYHVHYFSSAC